MQNSNTNFHRFLKTSFIRPCGSHVTQEKYLSYTMLGTIPCALHGKCAPSKQQRDKQADDSNTSKTCPNKSF